MIRSLPELVPLVGCNESFSAVVSALQAGHSGTIEGAWGSSSALAAAAIAAHAPGTLLIVLPRIADLDDFAADLQSLLPQPPTVFPAWESLPKEQHAGDAIFGARLRVLQLVESPTPPKVIVTSLPALLQPVPTRATRSAATRVLRVGTELDVEEFLSWLVERGFERVPALELPGEFSVHGGIVDVYPPASVEPIRIELFGDEIESIRLFDIVSQRKVEALQEVVMTAVAPAPKRESGSRGSDSPDGEQFDGESLLDLLPAGTWVALGELADLRDEGRQYLQRLSDPRGLYGVEPTLARCTAFPSVQIAALSEASYERTCTLRIESIERFTGAKAEVLNELASVVGRNEQVLIACHNEGERERLQELLQQEVPELAPRVALCLGCVTRGYRLVDAGVVVLSDNELFNRVEVRRTTETRRRRPESRAIDSFLELKEGDLVVHLTYGIGRYLGMKLQEREGAQEEHLEIEFRDHVRIFVPVTLIHLVQKYVGASKLAPRLSKVGGTTWGKQKQKVSEAVNDMAVDMLRLQAQRELLSGWACPPDSRFQQEFEAAFPYLPTADQARAFEEVKADLCQTRPMDRLICGDVGFGKTEVAIRAAFKMVDAGRQVAVLVPTTVLAEQHYRSFSARMAEFPVVLDVLSRFKSRKEQLETLDKLQAGLIDIVIGTHRLVQPDVQFRNLGLIIVDEEQRFGVEAKEMLKQLRLTVDVLTLSATPIPRTLHLSLLGIRDISSLTTPPADRVAIETRICRWDADLIRAAVVRELNRGGQVYFVHNKVYDIEEVAEKLQQIVPEARIVIGHGQMSGETLETAMLKFVSGQADILLATTIIESGIDIPNANTMFIDEAENYGLADLHQLRGRVGRYKHRAYCYLLTSQNKVLSGTAARRLKAIEEFKELGAGFKIAMRDLEIRGAGNILGTEQSGHISAVGYELYCQLLENAVRQLKSLPQKENTHVNIDLPVSAYLPSSYIPPGRHKMDVYRKISAITTLRELSELAEELRDRFGPLPEEAIHFLSLKELELLAYHWRIDNIRLEEERFAVFSYTDAQKIHSLAGRPKIDLRIVDQRNAYLLLPKANMRGPSLVEHLKSVLR